MRCAVWLLPGLWACGVSAAPEGQRAELARVEQALAADREKAAGVVRERQALEQKSREMREALVDVARLSRQYEERIATVEASLKTQEAQEARQAREWAANKAAWTRVLVLANRLAGASPVGLALTGRDPHRVVQGTLVLRSVLPRLRCAMMRLLQARDQLVMVRRTIADEQMMLTQAHQALARKQESFRHILEEQKQLGEKNKARQKSLERRIRFLATQASTLRELLDDLDAEQAMDSYRARKGTALGRAFRSLTGNLRLLVPVHGAVLSRFGEPKDGQKSPGLVFQAPPGGYVLSPAEGRVVFCGPFRSYRHIVIVDHGRGFHTLFAGMEQTVVPVGQDVLAGQPLGVMSRAENRRQLYMELRQDGEPVDPSPWLVKDQGKP
jgi:septal ring factor EnvC (AmiA/AmiB activator)